MQQDGSEYWTLPYKERLKKDAIEYKDLRDKLLEFIQLGSKTKPIIIDETIVEDNFLYQLWTWTR